VLVDAGNTALAKGGSGDILAGITASLIAQGCTAADACAAASYILGSTAQMLCKNASPRGILPTDILREIPRSLKAIEEM
jgi:NAD(P)H-hydrate epimerase